MAGIELRSPAFNDHGLIPIRQATTARTFRRPCNGPASRTAGAELVVLCEDLDGPSGTFLHWLLTGWGGPQPPAGDQAHRYFFRLYTLPPPVRLPADPDADDVHRDVDDAALASGTTVGLYQRRFTRHPRGRVAAAPARRNWARRAGDRRTGGAGETFARPATGRHVR